MIHNISNQGLQGPVFQNKALQKIVSQINADVGKKQNFDTVEFSKKALALLKEKTTKEKEPILNYEDSDIVHSTYWGTRTKAEFAEMSLSCQRDDLKTFSDQIDYAKAKLEFTTEKINELENYLNGTGTYSDLNMTRETAETYLYNYKQSIIDDYACFTIGKDQYHANEFDKLSGGLASRVFENPLHSLNADSLELSNLSSNPKEIMEALENVSKRLSEMTAKLESTFTEASGGKIFEEPARSMFPFKGDSPLDFFASQMEKGHKIVDSELDFNGETLEFDASLIISLDRKI